MRLPRSFVLFAAVVVGSAPAAAQDIPWKPYAEVTRGAEAAAGLFSVYYKRDQVLLGLTPEQFDRDYLLVTQLSQGIGDLGLDGGTSLRSDLIRFHRQGDRVELWVVNPRFAATPGTPMARAVDYSFGHSVAQAFPIATVRDPGESQILFDLTPFLLSDWADVGSTLQAAVVRRKLTGNVVLDDKRSSLQELRLFPANLEAEVRLTFQSPKNLGLETVSDSRSVPVGVHYSLLELPATPMRPRYADERVGYFISAFKDFSRDTAESFFVRYVNRWRLEKRAPGTVSEPVRPITYYIDHTVPLEWRPYVRAGHPGVEPRLRGRGLPQRHPGARRAGRLGLQRGGRPVLDRAVDRHQPLASTPSVPPTWIRAPARSSTPTSWSRPPGSRPGGASRTSTRRRWPRSSPPSPRIRRLEAGDPTLLCRFAEGLDRQGTVARALLAARGVVPSGGRRAAGVHRSGAEGAGHARGGSHPRSPPQLPRLRRHHGGAAGGPRAHRAPRTRRLGDGLRAAGALARSAAAGTLLLTHDRQLRPLGDHATATPRPVASSGRPHRQGRRRGRRRLDPRRRDQRAPRHRFARGGAGAPVRQRRGRGLRRRRPRPDRLPLRHDRRPARLGPRAGDADRRALRFAGDPGRRPG